ncbi:MAG: hypothetical protein FWF15_00725 [Oscillospiraceae bacterium]|nr:hypothetical protein [Oscillospiraceae bacterium]
MIEEFATSLIDGDKLKNFLDFNTFLKTNKVSKGSTGANGWSVRYKKKIICHFRIHNGYWLIYFFKDKELLEKSEKYVTDELKDFILNNINTTLGCRNCKGVENIIIYGQIFPKVCGCQLLLLNNPEEKILEYAKELVLINKTIANEIAAVRNEV